MLWLDPRDRSLLAIVKEKKKTAFLLCFLLFSITDIDAAQHTPAPAYRPR